MAVGMQALDPEEIDPGETLAKSSLDSLEASATTLTVSPERSLHQSNDSPGRGVPLHNEVDYVSSISSSLSKLDEDNLVGFGCNEEAKEDIQQQCEE
jgi:hypothetical protein